MNMKSQEIKIEVGETSASFSSNYSCQHSDSFTPLLQRLNIAIAFTSYQASRVCFIRAVDNKINLHLRSFPRPMGIYADERRLTLGTFSEIIDFRRSNKLLAEIKNGQHDTDANLSRKLQEKADQAREIVRTKKSREINQLKQADAIYTARSIHNSGMINIHDIAWGNEGLWVVNSTFSCLSTITTEGSFVARWKPPFISELVPEDRCHLNGMAMRDGEPRYVTTFNQQDTLDSWAIREPKGTLIDIKTNKLLKDDLYMPHSPRYHQGYIYVCNSAEGTVLRIDPDTGESKVLLELPGFTRGINFFNNLMFIGTSKIRQSDVQGEQIPLAEKTEETTSGIWVYDLEQQQITAKLTFQDSVEQIYDVAVIPQSNLPDVVSQNMTCARHLFDYTESML